VVLITAASTNKAAAKTRDLGIWTLIWSVMWILWALEKLP
jgi:hypothetical protein